jgi:phenolic acid decarboxylase
MAEQHVVTAAFVKVSIGSPTGNRVAVHLRRGDIVPNGVIESQLEHLVDRGLVEVEEIEEIEDAEEAEPEELDEGVYADVKVAELKALIKARNEGREDDAKIVAAEPGNRAEIVAALIADDNK